MYSFSTTNAFPSPRLTNWGARLFLHESPPNQVLLIAATQPPLRTTAFVAVADSSKTFCLQRHESQELCLDSKGVTDVPFLSKLKVDFFLRPNRLHVLIFIFHFISCYDSQQLCFLFTRFEQQPTETLHFPHEHNNCSSAIILQEFLGFSFSRALRTSAKLV